MHEYVYADRILQTVLDAIGQSPPRGIVVTVEVGEMLGLTRGSLRSAYQILSEGTRAEGSKLSVKFARGLVRCDRCGFEGRIPLRRHEHVVDPAFACPKCGSSLKVVAGTEVKLVSIQPPQGSGKRTLR